MSAIRILIVDDHAVLRSGLRLLVNEQPDMEVVGEAADGEQALSLAGALAPDVLTLDLMMPGTDGIETIQRLCRECPRTRVLVVTMHDDPTTLQSVLAAGGAGYFVKTAADTELLSAIRAVHQGRTFVNMSLTEHLVRTVVGRAAGKPEVKADGSAAILSPREREVLDLLVQGYTNQEVADRMFLSVKTTETYRSRLLAKLELRSRADLVRYAAEHGLTGQGKRNP